MSRRPFFRLAASLAVASLSILTPAVQAGGGCGCEAASTVYHVHQRCGHHCRHSCAPPAGYLVPSAPMMAAPMMAAPMMAAPVMPAQMVMAAPTVAMAPTQTLSVPVAAPQLQLSFAPQASTCAGSLTADQLRALQTILNNGNGNGSSALSAPSRSVDERLADLEQRVKELDITTREIVDILKVLKDK